MKAQNPPFPSFLPPLLLTAFLMVQAGARAAGEKAPPAASPVPATRVRAAAGSPPVTVTVFDGSPGREIPARFAGLSYELSTLCPDTNGVRYFRPDNGPLLEIFRTLGIRSLRVGGNLGDRDFKKAPSDADIDSLFAFAKAADAKVIYCLRLRNADPAEQARVAKYIWDRYEPQLECFTIGQEPSAYPVEKVDTRRADQRMGEAHEHYRYEDFATNWARFDDEIRKSIPDVRIGGPSVWRNTAWPLRFLQDFAKDGRVSMVTAHLYPGGPGNSVSPVPETGRDRMLSGEFETGYRSFADEVLPAAASNNLGVRIEEGNNYFNGGAKNVSDTFAASLWGLDFLWWWASRGAEGVNFHTGDRVSSGSTLSPCRYSSFHSIPGGIRTQPLGYGIKAFCLGGKGRIVPVNVSSFDPAKLSAYAALDSGRLLVTLINREHGADAPALDVTLVAGNPGGAAESIALTAPHGDVSATGGIVLGGSGIDPGGRWNGKWAPVQRDANGRFQLRIPPASALILRIPVSGPGLCAPPAMSPRPRNAEDAVTPVVNPRHDQFMREIRGMKGDVGLVLIGDSITDYWPNKGADSYSGFLPWKPLDLGVSGERTEQVLWRLLNGELEGYRARAVMIMIGTNNLRFADEKPEWVAAGIRKIVEAVREKQPDARILLLGVFPRGASPVDPMRGRIAEVNKLIARLDDGKTIHYADIGNLFLDAHGNLPRAVMPDYLHPNAEGYRIWFGAVKSKLGELMR